MILSIFSEINHLFKTKPNESWKPFLKEMELYEDFSGIYDDEDDPLRANRIVAFLVFCFSKDSDYIIAKMDWTENKIQIAQKIGFDPSLEDDLIFLNKKEYSSVMNFILYTLRDERWTELCTMKQVREEFLKTSIEKAPPSISYDDKLKLQSYKMLAITNSMALSKLIDSLHDEILRDEIKMDGAKYDFKQKIGSSFEDLALQS